jgi:hypothetical protein
MDDLRERESTPPRCLLAYAEEVSAQARPAHSLLVRSRHLVQLDADARNQAKGEGASLGIGSTAVCCRAATVPLCADSARVAHLGWVDSAAAGSRASYERRATT